VPLFRSAISANGPVFKQGFRAARVNQVESTHPVAARQIEPVVSLVVVAGWPATITNSEKPFSAANYKVSYLLLPK